MKFNLNKRKNSLFLSVLLAFLSFSIAYIRSVHVVVVVRSRMLYHDDELPRA